MRGKKVDTDFLSSFIMECVKLNKQSPDDFVSEARNRINEIDAKIKEVEQLKANRTKLLDVIEHFSTPVILDKTEDTKDLFWYSIPNQVVCKFITDAVKSGPIKISSLHNQTYTEQEVNFCIKNLLVYKVLARLEHLLIRGSKYQEYVNAVFKEK
jgi:hypothetical protein